MTDEFNVTSDDRPSAAPASFDRPMPEPFPKVPVVPTPERPAQRRHWIGWVIAAVILLVLCGCCVAVGLLFSVSDTSTTFGDSVAVIPIDGTIAGTGDRYSGYITPDYLRDQLKRADEDVNVKAIVLRVDSPGGTVAASEELAAYVKAAEKPIVVSVGDVGASGAYMLASQADQIWAMPGSSVGSIGVISTIPNVSGLMEKAGVEFQVITAGKNKDTGSMYRPMTDEEKALVQGMVDEAYDQFVDIVAEGRDMPRSEVESLATGWAWNGETAKKLGLVDELGTYGDALDAAADLGGIEGEYDVVTFDEPFDSVLGSLLGVKADINRLTKAIEGQPSTDAMPLAR